MSRDGVKPLVIRGSFGVLRKFEYILTLCELRCRPAIQNKVKQERVKRLVAARVESQRQVGVMRKETAAGREHLQRAKDGTHLLDLQNSPEQ